jgi:hypothetical protein
LLAAVTGGTPASSTAESPTSPAATDVQGEYSETQEGVPPAGEP